jgi:pimeloyl-ACP methyl ester carboxylesterase
MSGNRLVEMMLHKWLRIPYRLHVRLDQTIGRSKQTLVFIHGIGGTGDAWKEVIASLNVADVRIITVDLIGFGESPRPEWATYSTKFQARSLLSTLLRKGVLGKVTIVGHSMGSLVAVEMARRYPFAVKQLVLCSPPLYKETDSLLSPDQALRRLFRTVTSSPDQFVELSKLAKKYKLINRSFNITTKDFSSFVNALESAVINQTALADAERLKIPIEIIHGISDPVVPMANLFSLARVNKNVHVKTIIAGHEIIGSYVKPLVKILNRLLG